MPHPISILPLDHQVARAAAALPGAGAFDATPLEMCCAGFDFVTLYITYTRGAAGGAVVMRPEFAEDSTGAAWHRNSEYGPAIVAADVDSVSLEQAETITYTSNAAGAQTSMIGPFQLDGVVERMRVPCAESGVVGAPGTCAIEARFGCREAHAS